MSFISNTKTGLDTNSDGAVTSSFDIRTYTCMAWTAQGLTGSHDDHVITMQFSFDNINWINDGHLTGIDVTNEHANVPWGYIRFKVTQPEGKTSTVRIVINAK